MRADSASAQDDQRKLLLLQKREGNQAVLDWIKSEVNAQKEKLKGAAKAAAKKRRHTGGNAFPANGASAPGPKKSPGPSFSGPYTLDELVALSVGELVQRCDSLSISASQRAGCSKKDIAELILSAAPPKKQKTSNTTVQL